MKQIKPTKLDKIRALKAFEKYLNQYKSNSGHIRFDYDYNNSIEVDVKPIVEFTPLAYLKMQSLVQNAKEEIGWHGLVAKADNVYKVYDIIVYPQTVTAVTVSTDEVEYANWLMSYPDEVFNDIRLHGHSHVNMGVSPSSTDTDFYNNLLNNLLDDDYYIFMIINKKNELNIWIYDSPNNIIFETKDIQVNVKIGDLELNEWYSENVKANVKKPITRKQKERRWYDDFLGGDFYDEPK